MSERIRWGVAVLLFAGGVAFAANALWFRYPNDAFVAAVLLGVAGLVATRRV